MALWSFPSSQRRRLALWRSERDRKSFSAVCPEMLNFYPIRSNLIDSFQLSSLDPKSMADQQSLISRALTEQQIQL
jgi:hypothetical protein